MKCLSFVVVQVTTTATTTPTTTTQQGSIFRNVCCCCCRRYNITLCGNCNNLSKFVYVKPLKPQIIKYTLGRNSCNTDYFNLIFAVSELRHNAALNRLTERFFLGVLIAIHIFGSDKMKRDCVYSIVMYCINSALNRAVTRMTSGLLAILLKNIHLAIPIPVHLEKCIANIRQYMLIYTVSQKTGPLLFLL